MPLNVGRAASLAAVEAALLTEEKELVFVAQRSASNDAPQQSDLYGIGTKGIIKQMTRPSESMMELVVVGVERTAIIRLEQTTPYLRAAVRPLPPPEGREPEVDALQRELIGLATKAVKLIQPQAPPDLSRIMAASEDPLWLAYLLASMMSIEVDKEQALLEAPTRVEALRLVYGYLSHEVQVLELRNKIASEAQNEMSREQREYLLRQQLRAIQQELGEKNPEQAEVQMLTERLEKADLPDDVRSELQREISRLERLPPTAPDYHVTQSYIEFALELPWRVSTRDALEIARAREVLDDDHYDLKDVKARILEHLGVLKLNPQAKAPILCFVGPPGVGKTSLGQSIARALGRKFERLSLGGLHDEAELRGHRRTYIGAMPGRIVQAIRRAGANNPVLMLDEVDKLGRDFRGDPAAALLEILDPEQNRTFRDNYLDMAFDLSRVLFVTTANSLETIPAPLLDRMETLRLPGYSSEEKLEIANRYLVPRQIRETGLTPEQCVFTPDSIREIISGYTREAGVRQLERNIGSVARKVALRFAEGNVEPVMVGKEEISELLGPRRFAPDQLRRDFPPGVATGLAWTETGGDVLYIEATLLPDARALTLTGHLGEVMQESVRAAQSYVWSHADELGVDRAVFRRNGVHVHVPAGAIPKDGPSAGITMAVALASVYTGCPVLNTIAMTGEITLTGLVLPVGGIKEKVLAGRRLGIHHIVMPAENEKDLRDLPEHVRADTKFTFVSHAEEALAAAIPQLGERLSLMKGV